MLKEIILTKPWGDHASGEVVKVDPVRAAKLILDGTGVSASVDAMIEAELDRADAGQAAIHTAIVKGRKRG